MFIAIGIVVALLTERVRKAEQRSTYAYTELNQLFNTTTDGISVFDKNFEGDLRDASAGEMARLRQLILKI